MFIFETLIYGCLMFIVPLHCCQNLTLPNVPSRRSLPGNPTTAASATVCGLNGRTQGHELWPQSGGYYTFSVMDEVIRAMLLRARN